MGLSQGDRLGRYEVIAPLGAGGMGEVYRAEDTELEREVAIKILPHAVADVESRLERFKREAKAVAALSHPNILQIFDVGSDEGIQFAVTELLDGQTLRERIPSTGLSWQKAVEYGARIADGLAAAHTRGIIHRDLKPENIFVSSDDRIKLLDFGLAAIREEIDSEAETGTLTPAGTEAGTILGTPGYMAPEQIKGQPADHRSDIFALGCVLYEMVSGQRAFGGDTGMEVLASILKEDPPHLSSSAAAFPDELGQTIHRCLEKSPDARFQSAADLAFGLRAIGTSPLAVMAPPTDRGKPSAPMSIRRWLQTLAVVATLGVVGVVGWKLWPSVDGSETTAERARPMIGASSSTTYPFIDEWVVSVEPFENHTGDARSDSTGTIIADRLADNLGRVTRGLKAVPTVTVVLGDAGGFEAITTEPPPPATGRMLIDGSYISGPDGLEVIARVRDGISGSVLFATTPFTVPERPDDKALEPLLQRVMGALAVHIDQGLAHVSHVPDHRVAHSYLMAKEGLLTGGSGNTKPMRAAMKAAFEEDPEYLAPAAYLAALQLWYHNPDEAQAYLDHIRQRAHRFTEFEGLELALYDAWLQGSPGQALRVARQIQELAPDRIRYRLFRMHFASVLNRPGEVVATAAGVVEHLPERLPWFQWWTLVKLGEAYEQMGDYDQALALARRMRRDAPGDASAFEGEAAALAGLGRFDELDALVEECRLMPGGECYAPRLLFVAFGHLAATGRFEASTEYARRAAVIFESTPEDVLEALPEHEIEMRRWTHMQALRAADRRDDYLEFSERMAAWYPDDPYYRVHVGMAAALTGDRDRAESVIAEMEAKGIWQYVAYVAASLGDLERAVETFRDAIEFNREFDFSSLPRADPDLRPLLGYEPFEDLVRPRG